MIVIVGIALALVILALVFWMLLTRRLREKYAVMWIVIALSVLLLGIFPQLLLWATSLLGVQVPANLLFALAITLLLGVALHLSWELSQAEDEIRRVAEEAALSRAEIDRLDRRIAALEAQHRGRDADSAPPA
ncbi:hypothetical protein BMW26_05980 [Microbacterium sp. 1.5R]|uniref:DUF2304 domain-containing protein n=1 Tax=Microbacterium TaxID=33882 RepID=UPI00069EAB18|nr:MULTISPECIES: DUF2304 domain-containing protein [unclassified Microbacterium]AKV85170.1 hypothetical protein AKG07_01410 [Microbacterium sp. CGR1]APH44560.1 hypothetical protein BMW26_05980 [Microbacterium sp. 1.5R]KRD51725.1 hypothetical protein ASE34_07215 [Microbacterium sp. Root280D1]MBC6494209.1 hypothetical protein [Microbacterium sp. 4-7]MDY0982327.1 DUF2304 domain-containing protein [Microbacterium sp. CFBP9023]